MPTPKTETETFASVDPEQLATVAGGTSRVTSRSSGADDQVTAMLSSIGDSIKSLAANNQNSGGDTMQMMLMMLMMGGMGGGGGAVAAAPAAIAPPVVNVDTSLAGGGCRGKKGW